MEDGSLLLPKFRLKTPNSDVEINLDMPLSVMDKTNPGAMRLGLDASLGKQDLMYFMAQMPVGFQRRWPDEPLHVKGSIQGNMSRMDFTDVEVQLPTAFHAKATGYAAHLDDPQHLQADVRFNAVADNLGFVTAMLSRDMQRNYRIPRGIRASGRVRAHGEQYFADITAREGKGTVKASGSFHSRAMRYDGRLSVRDLNVHHFMPRDSIYTLTADITAKGKGFDFLSPRTTLQAEAQIHRFHYGLWHLDHITALADVHGGRAHATIQSQNSLLRGLINLDALMAKDHIDATLSTDLSKVDLYQLNVSDESLSIGLCGHFDVFSDLKLTHQINGLINDLTIRDSAKIYRPSDIGLLLRTTPDTTYLRAQSGDFVVKVDGSGNYEWLLNRFSVLSDSVSTQLKKKVIDQPALRELLPTMRLHLESQRENPVAMLLKTSQDIDFKDVCG